MIEKSAVTKGWYSTEFSGRLSGRQRKNTQPELLLRRTLHALGARFRLQQRVAPRILADIAFTKQRVAVFVDGCFWHGCPIHGRREFRGPNAQKWVDKIQRNRDRDTRASGEAQDEGWKVLRFWECEVKDDPEKVATQVLIEVRKGAAEQ